MCPSSDVDNPLPIKSSNPATIDPRTHFAPPERASREALEEEYAYIGRDPVIDGLMRAVGGLVAVLNEQRQVLALNAGLLRLLGLETAADAMGLRLGEAVHCVHAHEMPAGCGTSQFCSTCGAAIAQVTSLAQDRAVERICAIDVHPPIDGSEQVYFRVQACPIRRGDRRIILLFLQDVSEEQQRAVLNRTFFHDVKNTLCAILGAGEMLAQDPQQPDAQLADSLVQMTRRLSRELELQRCLVTSRMDQFERAVTRVSAAQVLDDVARMCVLHPAAQGKRLRPLPPPEEIPPLTCDAALLSRVLQNMAVNALEATAEGGEVRLSVAALTGGVEFCTWNDAVMPAEVAQRVFQRNFSTKGTLGRGLGTYSMKLLGERVLGGRVSFTSRTGEGTCFRAWLPVQAADPEPGGAAA